MASFIETWVSRQGGTVGLFGSRAITRVVQVTTDADEDDPVIALTTMAGGIFIGQPFPSASSPWTSRIDGMVAIGFNYGRRLAPTVWEVVVIYGPPVLIESAVSAWEIELTSGVTTEHVFDDLDNKPIGSLVFKELADAASPTDGGPRLLAKFADGKEQYLTVAPPPLENQADDRPRYVDGADRTTEVGSVRLSRLFPNLNATGLELAFSKRNHINSDTVRVRTTMFPSNRRNVPLLTLAPPETLKFVQASARAEFGTLNGIRGQAQTVEGQVWRVTLDFDHDPRGWQLRRMNKYRPNKPGLPDVEVPVRSGQPPNDLFIETFRLYNRMDMTEFLESFG